MDIPLTLEPASPEPRFSSESFALSPASLASPRPRLSPKLLTPPFEIVNDTNRHLFPNYDKLVKLAEGSREFTEDGECKLIPGGWATDKGVIYGFESSGCYPSIDELTALKYNGIILRGKIIMVNGSVYNADIEYEMCELDEVRTEELMKIYCKNRMESRILFGKREFHKSVETVYERGPYGEVLNGGYELQWDTPKTIVIKPGDHPYRAGVFHLHERKHTVDRLPTKKYRLCDDHDCCLSSHIMLNISNESSCHESEDCEKWHRERPIYIMKDEKQGNCNLCFQCIMLNISSDCRIMAPDDNPNENL